jgi:hypothetical protein
MLPLLLASLLELLLVPSPASQLPGAGFRPCWDEVLPPLLVALPQLLLVLSLAGRLTKAEGGAPAPPTRPMPFNANHSTACKARERAIQNMELCACVKVYT